MAELSRKKRYQELRDQLDQQNAQPQTPAEPVKLSRSSKPATAAPKPAAAAPKAAPSAASRARPALETVGVMDELLGEVKQYNIDKGDRVTEDTQINILRTLDEAGDIEMKRRAHLETMEPNLSAGGTTMNIDSKDIEAVSKASATSTLRQSKAANSSTASSTRDNLDVMTTRNSQAIADHLADNTNTSKAAQTNEAAGKDQDQRESTINVPVEDHYNLLENDGFIADADDSSDNLEMFDLSADDFDKTIRQELPEEKPVSRKEAKKAKKARKAAEKSSRSKAERMMEETEPTDQYYAADPYDDMEDDEPRKSSKLGNIILIVLILALIALIGYTIYLISKANLL